MEKIQKLYKKYKTIYICASYLHPWGLDPHYARLCLSFNCCSNLSVINQNGQSLADVNFRGIFMNENIWTSKELPLDDIV